MRASEASARDAKNLYDNGFKTEAKAVYEVSKNQRAKAEAAQQKYEKRKSKHYVRNTLLIAGGVGVAALASNEDARFAVGLGKDFINAMKSEIKITKAFYEAHPEALKKLATM